jgi:hypothetical protein
MKRLKCFKVLSYYELTRLNLDKVTGSSDIGAIMEDTKEVIRTRVEREVMDRVRSLVERHEGPAITLSGMVALLLERGVKIYEAEVEEERLVREVLKNLKVNGDPLYSQIKQIANGQPLHPAK